MAARHRNRNRHRKDPYQGNHRLERAELAAAREREDTPEEVVAQVSIASDQEADLLDLAVFAEDEPDGPPALPALAADDEADGPPALPALAADDEAHGPPALPALAADDEPDAPPAPLAASAEDAPDGPPAPPSDSITETSETARAASLSGWDDESPTVVLTPERRLALQQLEAARLGAQAMPPPVGQGDASPARGASATSSLDLEPVVDGEPPVRSASDGSAEPAELELSIEDLIPDLISSLESALRDDGPEMSVPDAASDPGAGYEAGGLEGLSAWFAMDVAGEPHLSSTATEEPSPGAMEPAGLEAGAIGSAGLEAGAMGSAGLEPAVSGEASPEEGRTGPLVEGEAVASGPDASSEEDLAAVLAGAAEATAVSEVPEDVVAASLDGEAVEAAEAGNAWSPMISATWVEPPLSEIPEPWATLVSASRDGAVFVASEEAWAPMVSVGWEDPVPLEPPPDWAPMLSSEDHSHGLPELSEAEASREPVPMSELSAERVLEADAPAALAGVVDLPASVAAAEADEPVDGAAEPPPLPMPRLPLSLLARSREDDLVRPTAVPHLADLRSAFNARDLSALTRAYVAGRLEHPDEGGLPAFAGMALLGWGALPEARAILVDGLEHDPDCPFLYEVLVELELRAGRPESARRVMDAAVDRFPAEPGRLRRLAHQAIRMGELLRAQRMIRRAIEASDQPDDDLRALELDIRRRRDALQSAAQAELRRVLGARLQGPLEVISSFVTRLAGEPDAERRRVLAERIGIELASIRSLADGSAPKAASVGATAADPKVDPQVELRGELKVDPDADPVAAGDGESRHSA